MCRYRGRSFFIVSTVCHICHAGSEMTPGTGLCSFREMENMTDALRPAVSVIVVIMEIKVGGTAIR